MNALRTWFADLQLFLDDKKTIRHKRRELFRWARGVAVNTDTLEIVYDEIVSKGVLEGYAAKNNIPQFRENVELAFIKRLAEAAGTELPQFDERMKIQWINKEIEPVIGWRYLDDNRIFINKKERKNGSNR